MIWSPHANNIFHREDPPHEYDIVRFASRHMKQQRPIGTLRKWYTAVPRFASGKRSMAPSLLFHIGVLCETERLRECVLRAARGDADI